MELFMGKSPHDHLYLVSEGYKHWTANDLYHADSDTIQYWLTLAKCRTSTIPGQNFADLFPDSALALYQDDCGNSLDDIIHQDMFYWQRLQASEPRLLRQGYVKCVFLPRYTAALLSHLQVIVVTLHNELAANVPKRGLF